MWSKIVQERRREDDYLKVVEADGALSTYEKARGRVIRTPIGNVRLPSWLSGKAFIFLVAVGALIGGVVGQPLQDVEQSNCLAMSCCSARFCGRQKCVQCRVFGAWRKSKS